MGLIDPVFDLVCLNPATRSVSSFRRFAVSAIHVCIFSCSDNSRLSKCDSLDQSHFAILKHFVRKARSSWAVSEEGEPDSVGMYYKYRSTTQMKE